MTGAYSAVVATATGLYRLSRPARFPTDGDGPYAGDNGRVDFDHVCFRKSGTRTERLRGLSKTIFRTVAPFSSTANSNVDRRVRGPARAATLRIRADLLRGRRIEDDGRFDIRSYRWRAGRDPGHALVLEKAIPRLCADIDLVVPIPHSPIPGAEALCSGVGKRTRDGSALQYATPVSKYRYGGRIFMEETQKARDAAAMLDFRVDTKAVEGQEYFSCRRQHRARHKRNSRIVRAFRAAGAPRKINLRHACGRWSSIRVFRASTRRPRSRADRRPLQRRQSKRCAPSWASTRSSTCPSRLVFVGAELSSMPRPAWPAPPANALVKFECAGTVSAAGLTRPEARVNPHGLTGKTHRVTE